MSGGDIKARNADTSRCKITGSADARFPFQKQSHIDAVTGADTVRAFRRGAA
jgi:hypothetical protein